MSLDVYLECECCKTIIYSRNVTHNMVPMAQWAGVYDCCWKPVENKFVTANDIIVWLEIGLVKLKAEPAEARKFNPENGWGNYQIFVEFIEDYLDACKERPTTLIRVSR